MGCAASHHQGTVHPNYTKDNKTKNETPKRKDSSSSNDSKEEHEKPVVVFVLGGPGSGKGTQCERIVKEYGFTHFSVGDLLRAEKTSGSKTAKLIDEYIAEGKLVPAKIPVKLIKKAMKKAGWENNYYLVDGFPRNQENLEAWESVFKSKVDVKFTLFYECSFEVMEKRIMERAKTSGRSDDNLESMKKRFNTYETETKPVVEHFTTKNLIRKINAERPVEEVFADTKVALDSIKDSLGKKNTETKQTEKQHVEEKQAEQQHVEQKKAEQHVEEKQAEQQHVEKKAPEQQHVEEKQAETQHVEPKQDTDPKEVEKTHQEPTPAERQSAQPEQDAVHQDTKPNVIFVLGGPGSGKGTQCEKIIHDFGLKHLSVGDLLRAEKTKGSDLAKELDEIMAQGKLVPSEIPVKLLKQAIDGAPKGTNFLIDGFPRNKENIDVWNKHVGDAVTLSKILFFECSFDTMEKRILERAKVSGRSDDNAESLKKRFDTYQNESAPVVEEYEKSGMLVKINAERDVADVYADTKQTLNALQQ